MASKKYSYWMVVAKETNMGDVEVWHSDYEDCVDFYNGNDGMINGAHLEIVPDLEMEELMKSCSSSDYEIEDMMETIITSEEVIHMDDEYDFSFLEELPLN
jgi:hypothetical protein